MSGYNNSNSYIENIPHIKLYLKLTTTKFTENAVLIGNYIVDSSNITFSLDYIYCNNKINIILTGNSHLYIQNNNNHINIKDILESQRKLIYSINYYSFKSSQSKTLFYTKYPKSFDNVERIS